LNLNLWYHIADVYDRSTSKEIIYLNGKQDGSRTSSNSYIGNASKITFGVISAVRIIHFHAGSYLDFRPKKINNISTFSTIFHSNGRLNQALLINSTSLSYFQNTGFYYLGQSNYSYSFSLWICPLMNNGTILQVRSFEKKAEITLLLMF
jgi:hypothetical protein